MKRLFLISVLLTVMISLTIGCRIRQTPDPIDLNSVVMTLERTVCYGICPEYKLTIYGDGNVEYEGRRFVKIEGKKAITISEEKVRQLLAEFQRIDYFSLEDSYEELMATDMPSAYTSLTIDGKTKTVRHYHGDFNAPEKLTDLEDKIDEIVDSNQWIK